MSKLKIGVVGCGGIANQKHFPAMKANSDLCEIVAFCDIIKERAEKGAAEYGVEGARVYEDYHDLLADSEVEVVHVLTPNVAHCPITVAAFEAGKHVYCEKPMAHNTEDAKAMLDAWKKSGKQFTIGYQNRFRPEVQNLKKACEAGELGDIYYGKAHAVRRRAVPTWGVFPDKSKQGGGPLIDIGTHALDLTLWMMDNYEPASVTGSVFRKLADQKETGNAWGDWDPEVFTVEDSAFGFIKMKNGATIQLEASWALNSLEVDEAKTTLCGTKAGADMKDGLRINRVQYGRQCVEKPDLSSGGVDYFDGEAESVQDVEQRVFYDAVVNGKPLTVEPEQALVVTQILEAVYESARTGRTVYFD